MVLTNNTIFQKNTTIYAHWTEPYKHEQFLTDDRDGKTYAYVEITGKRWMAENLSWDGAEDGKPAIPAVGVCYDDDPANCEIYGRLYAHNDALTACPEGWFLPTLTDWLAVENEYGINSGGGAEKFRSKGYWGAARLGTDEFGFSALPAGIVNQRGAYADLGNSTWIWSLEPTDVMSLGNIGVTSGIASSRPAKASVRCVQD